METLVVANGEGVVTVTMNRPEPNGAALAAFCSRPPAHLRTQETARVVSAVAAPPTPKLVRRNLAI